MPTNENQVYCAHSRMVDPRTLRAHPLNPNDHPDEQIRLFQEVLRFNGWRRSIAVSTRSGFVTKGHGALLAALSMGLALVPVDDQAYESEEQEIADMVADNKLSEWSNMSHERMAQLMARAGDGLLSAPVMGMDESEFQGLMASMSAQGSMPLAAPGALPHESDDGGGPHDRQPGGEQAPQGGAREMPEQGFQSFAHTCPRCGFGFDK